MRYLGYFMIWAGGIIIGFSLTPPSGVGDGLPAPSGYKVVITTDVKCHKDGDEMTLKEMQRAIEVNDDGVLGPVTVGKVLLYNRTDKRNL
jgi:hypothetical protein